MGKGQRSTRLGPETPTASHPLARFLGIWRLPQDVTIQELSHALRMYDLRGTKRDELLHLQPGELNAWQKQGYVPQSEQPRLAALVAVLAYLSDSPDRKTLLHDLRYRLSSHEETVHLFARLTNDSYL